MTNSVQRDQSDNSAVKPVIFSHEAADEPTPRPTSHELAHDIAFSADTTDRRPAQ